MTTNAEGDRQRSGRYPIGVVSQRTGLSKDVLRVWESRYGVVRPARSESGRRLYSDADVERLALLKAATSLGWSIGEVADRTTDELRELARPTSVHRVPAPDTSRGSKRAADLVADCLEALTEMSADRLDAFLSRGMVELPSAVFLDEVVAALLREIGDRWERGQLDPGQEHLASASIRAVLARMISAMSPDLGSPGIVIATPIGEGHELGAMLAAATAAASGWRATFLGADLPAEHIAAAVRRTGAAAVGLSLVTADGAVSDRRVDDELDRLRTQVGEGVTVFLGGASSDRYEDAAGRIRARRVESLAALRSSLEEWVA